MKYSEMPTKKDSLGFEFVNNLVMKGDITGPCMICGEPTVFIDVCSEGKLCSEECNRDWYAHYDKLVAAMEGGEEIANGN